MFEPCLQISEKNANFDSNLLLQRDGMGIITLFYTFTGELIWFGPHIFSNLKFCSCAKYECQEKVKVIHQQKVIGGSKWQRDLTWINEDKF